MKYKTQIAIKKNAKRKKKLLRVNGREKNKKIEKMGEIQVDEKKMENKKKREREGSQRELGRWTKMARKKT